MDFSFNQKIRHWWLLLFGRPFLKGLWLDTVSCASSGEHQKSFFICGNKCWAPFPLMIMKSFASTASWCPYYYSYYSPTTAPQSSSFGLWSGKWGNGLRFCVNLQKSRKISTHLWFCTCFRVVEKIFESLENQIEVDKGALFCLFQLI